MNRHYSHYTLYILRKTSGSAKARQAWQVHETLYSQAHAIKLARFLASLDEIEKVRVTGIAIGVDGHMLRYKHLATYSAFWRKLLGWRGFRLFSTPQQLVK